MKTALSKFAPLLTQPALRRLPALLSRLSLLLPLLSLLLPLPLQAQQLPQDSLPARQLPQDSLPARQLPQDSLPAPVPEAAASVSLPAPKVTPVDIDDRKPRQVLHYFDKHGNPLEEPVMFLATLDTVQKAQSKPLYPKYNGLNLGLNFGDLIFMAFGQRYASFDLWANVSLFNWIFPTLECGLGFVDDTPDKANFTYKTKPSFYVKAGLNYNFLYKSNPDYQVFLGLRAGVSRFRYDIDDITISSDYWDETQRFSLKGLSATSWYGEVLAGIQVQIVSHFSLGWSARYHYSFHTSQCRGNKPWFIPGYGGSSPISMTVSAVWTIPGPSSATVTER